MAYVKLRVMTVRKKNFVCRDIKVYPKNLDLSKRCFVRFYIAEGYKHEIYLSAKFNTLESRRIEADRIIKDLELNGFSLNTNEVVQASNKDIELFYDLLNTKTKLAKNTVSKYRTHIKTFDSYCIENKISTITFLVADAFLQHLSKSLCERTVNAYRKTFNIFYSKLLKQKKVKSNPFENTESLSTERPFSEHYSKEDLVLILAEIRKSKPFLLLPFLTIYYCFIRNGRELPHIKVSDIDFKACKIWVNAEFSKNRKKDAVLIPNQLMKEFYAADLHHAPPQYFAFGRDGKPSAKPVGRNYYQDNFRDILNSIGIYKKGKGIYRAKNSGNVALVKANFNRTAIQKQNRHSSFATTESYIASLLVDDFDELKDNFPSLS